MFSDIGKIPLPRIADPGAVEKSLNCAPEVYTDTVDFNTIKGWIPNVVDAMMSVGRQVESKLHQS